MEARRACASTRCPSELSSLLEINGSQETRAALIRRNCVPVHHPAQTPLQSLRYLQGAEEVVSIRVDDHWRYSSLRIMITESCRRIT